VPLRGFVAHQRLISPLADFLEELRHHLIVPGGLVRVADPEGEVEEARGTERLPSALNVRGADEGSSVPA
jgi:hypothetical protein